MDARREHFIWAEKYRPRKVAECILPTEIKTTLQQFVDQGLLPNLLFYGSSGVGKTTAARAMCDEIEADCYLLNGSMHGGIDTLRVEIAEYASSVSLWGGRKYVILDEADYLTAATQPALRGFMEQYAKNCGFIFTCNHLERIIIELRSRCANIAFHTPTESEKRALMMAFFKRLAMLLENENIQFDSKAVGALILQHFPDMRRIINELQRYSVHGKIDSGILAKIKQSEVETLIPLLKSKDFGQVRKWLAENAVDTTSLIKELDRRAEEMVEPSSLPQLIQYLNECDFRSTFVSDPEVNLAAHLAAIMSTCTFK